MAKILPVCTALLLSVYLCGPCPATAPALAPAPKNTGSQSQELAAALRFIDEGALLTAKPLVERLLTTAPGNKDVCLAAARLYQRMGLSTLAILYYEKVRMQSPHMLEALVALARLHLENLSSSLALEMASEAVAIAPDSKEARLVLVESLLAAQSLKRARSEASELVARFPRDADVLHCLSLVSQSFGEDDQALSYMSAATQERPRQIAWLMELADLYQSVRNYNKAADVLNRVLEIDPQSIGAIDALARLYEFDLEDYLRARDYYLRILAILPDSGTARGGADRCLAKQADLALWLKGNIYRLFGCSSFLSSSTAQAKLAAGSGLK